MKLTIELVPSTSFYSNVRSNVTPAQWDVIRKASYKEANHRCQICEDTGKNQGVKHDVECHEIWDYIEEDGQRIQRLVGLTSLCPYCHKVKHAGLASIKGETDTVISQLVKVNRMSTKEAQQYLNDSFKLWRERSEYDWKLDISYLTKNNLI